MTLAGKLELIRAARVPIGRSATLRERGKFASDILVEDLSVTGCRFRSQIEMSVGTLVSVGIPGIGMHAARITRVDEQEHGCAFLLPLTDADIEHAQHAETVASPEFPRMRERIRAAEAEAYSQNAVETPRQSFASRMATSLRTALPGKSARTRGKRPKDERAE